MKPTKGTHPTDCAHCSVKIERTQKDFYKCIHCNDEQGNVYLTLCRTCEPLRDQYHPVEHVFMHVVGTMRDSYAKPNKDGKSCDIESM